MWIFFNIVILTVYCFTFSHGVVQFSLNFARSTNKVVVIDHYYMLEYSIYRDGERLQSVVLGTGLGGYIKSRKTGSGFVLYGRGDEIEFSIEVDDSKFSQLSISRRNIQKSVSDCIDLASESDVHWYGGNQQRWQYYPIQKLVHKHNAYVTKEEFNQAIAERYWFNSQGIFFYVNLDAPLFIDQNNQHPDFMCLEAKRALPYDIYHTRFDFTYHIGIGLNARDVHMKAVEYFLGKPSGHPALEMVRDPIWSTWARYKTNVDEATVRVFANEILSYGFNGQFELDDDYETCYGALEFRQSKFPNIKNLTDDLHAVGFRVTLWVHPFINKDCKNWFEEAKQSNYFVADHSGNIETQWWNSEKSQAAYIDFTKTAAADWYYNRLRSLQISAGIDSFKFDAGESSWVPIDPVLNGTAKEHPSKITSAYVRTVSKFGSLVEVRSGQNTQDLPIFVRMIDKDTEWSLNNGLPTLITTLLQMNMVGYPFVLPDMIGGNGYNDNRPDEEIFVRWLQANVFMPSLQFSYVPWDYLSGSVDVVALSKRFVDLHAEFTPHIMNCFEKAVSIGAPVNPPIWWIAPNDKIAQSISDEFLLGEDILAAPVIEKG
ncbi:hypothetical protein ACKWTF_002268 [Chironomus riparius]